MEVLLPAHLRYHDRPTDQQTDMRGHKKVTLPVMSKKRCYWCDRRENELKDKMEG